MRSLDAKLERILNGHYSPQDFIIADAKDGDMAFGCATPGAGPDGRMRGLDHYRADMERVTASGLVDIMLMSLSTAEVLQDRALFDGSAVTPAVRLNDTTDIWQARGGCYPRLPARMFRTARLDRAREVADLGLFSVTFHNDLDHDMAMLNAYSAFRDEAEAAGMRHFLEVFNPQAPVTVDGDFATYNNDMIVRCLAGVSRRDRPLFLKAAYNGPGPTEEIAGYDSRIVFGILGGGAGRTRDCLELLAQAERYGARVALFGRKIYRSEDSLCMLRAMRRVIEERISSSEGVKAYHADLAAAGIAPFRSLEDDLTLTEEVLIANAP
jgi:DhnA family fructose-bisphosphate aldolase class Ia